jgi:light-regulated signal transduction histidine kinase (bacteriophytochrome)
MPMEAQLAEALRENAELKKALEECSNARQAAQTTADRAVKELQDFVYATSHDLQEPLRAVSAYAQLLQRKYAEDAETSELTAFIIQGAKRVTSLLQALLAYSRAGNSPQRSMIGLDQIMQSALFKLNDRIRQSGASIACGELPEVLADAVQLGQVLEQLITNALSYSFGEPPRIEITAEEGNEEYTISVRNNGKGIEPRFHDLIFLPFKRLHGKEVPGAGLGLAVCRKIIAAHGGKIWVESDGQQGSTFKFTIPF